MTKFGQKIIVAVLLVMVFQKPHLAFCQQAPPSATKTANNFYVEVFGGSLLYSFNYDTRFSKSRDGIGGRLGIGYFNANGKNFFALPVNVNYLAGKGGKYFEVGGGITYYTENTNALPFASYENNKNANGVASSILGTVNFGYRSQPEDGGYCFRVGVAPVITKTLFNPLWPYISFGYTF